MTVRLIPRRSSAAVRTGWLYRCSSRERREAPWKGSETGFESEPRYLKVEKDTRPGILFRFFPPPYFWIPRRIVHIVVTALPSNAWTVQQLREATPWSSDPRYLIRERERECCTRFSSIAASTGIKELKTPYRAPKANAFCERFMESLKRDCLDHMLVMSQKQMERLVREYVSYYNDVRPHQGIHQRIPGRYNEKGFPSQSGKIISEPILGGLHHDYTRIAYLN